MVDSNATSSHPLFDSILESLRKGEFPTRSGGYYVHLGCITGPLVVSYREDDGPVEQIDDRAAVREFVRLWLDIEERRQHEVCGVSAIDDQEPDDDVPGTGEVLVF